MLPLIGLGLGLLGGVGKMISRGQANKDIEKLIGQDPSYSANPLVGQRLGLMKTLLNARMPGAATAERNIYGNQANQLGAVDRGATDASQALAIKAGIGANTNTAFQDLSQREAGDYQRRLDNVYRAEEGVIGEGDKVYGDQVRRFGNLTQFKGAQSANKAANWGDLSNLGFGLADFGMSGGFKGLFGGGGSGSGARGGGLGSMIGRMGG